MNSSSRNTQEKPNEVPSANFSTVDLATVEDILGIAREEDILDRLNPGFLSNILKEIRELRKKQRVHNRRNGRRNEKKLRELFLFMTMVAADANKEAFREKVTESEIQETLDYFIEEMSSFARKQNWINSGALVPSDLHVLHFCEAMIAANAFPINLLFKSEFVQCFANFVTARKGTGRALPSEDVCSSIGSIVYCVLGHAEEESRS